MRKFEWDEDNLRKILAQQIEREETEQALLNNPIPVAEQDVEGVNNYPRTNSRMLAANSRLFTQPDQRGSSDAYDLLGKMGRLLYRGFSPLRASDVTCLQATCS